MATAQPARGSFIRGIWMFLTGLHAIVGLVIGFFILAGIVGIVGLASQEEEFEIPESGAMVLAPSGVIVEQKTGANPDEALQQALLGGAPSETLLKDVIDAIRFAAEDDRIEGIVLGLDNFAGAGASKLHYIARELDRFKESGKPIYAYGNGYNQSAYLLAAHADEVAMHPFGAVTVTGYGRYRTYFKDLLDQLEVNVNVFKVGTFKSAVEPFIRQDMSPEAAEANEAYLDALWTEYAAEIDGARGLGDGGIVRIVESFPALAVAAGGDLAQVALEQNLVDELLYTDEFRAKMIEVFGEKEREKKNDTSLVTFEQVGFKTFLDERRSKEKKDEGEDGKVAVVVARGSIVDGEAPEGTIGGDSVAKLIRRAREDEDVKAIVLRVDSGGGSVFGSEVIRRELEVAKEQGIKIVSSMGSVAASGGYWISTPADEIWAAPTTITGSIGIFGLFPTFDRTLAMVGINTDGVGTTRLTGAFDATRPLQDDVAAIIQANIEKGYERFIGMVAETRDMTVEEVDAIAQGRVWAGTTALDLGLVDRLGYLDEAVEAAARLAEIEDYAVWYVKRPKPPFQQFIEELTGEAAEATADAAVPQAAPALPPEVYAALSEAMELARYNDPNHAYARCLTCPVAW